MTATVSPASCLPWLLALAVAGCSSPPGDSDSDAGGRVADAAALADAAPPDAEPPDAAPPDAAPLIYDCEDLPQGPFALKRLPADITASEDLAFDADGHLVGANDSTIFKSSYDGTRAFFASLSFRAGLRFSADGDLMVNDDTTGRLVRIEGDGTKHTVVSGLSYPNGMEVGQDGYIYVTEHNAGRVRRVHPTSGDFTVIAEGLESPNGVTFNEDYTALYIDEFSGVGTIYKLPIDADGNPGSLQEWSKNVGTGWLDGMAVDACGNVYVCDYGATIIYRISPDGASKTPIIEAADDGYTYLPNMQWGSGIGGWDPMKLYIPDGWTHDVFEVELGVPAKPRVYP